MQEITLKIRIRIRVQDPGPNPDPKNLKMLDPDPYLLNVYGSETLFFTNGNQGPTIGTVIYVLYCRSRRRVGYRLTLVVVARAVLGW